MVDTHACTPAQSCPTLCYPVNCSPPGSPVHGISQARILEWVAISSSRGSSWPRDWTWVSCTAGRHFIIWTTREALLLLSSFSRVQLCATPETAAHQAPQSLGFSRQEHWSGLPFPSPMHEVKSESEVAQSCPTLRDPMNCSLPGSSVHGIFQARVLEWGAITFSVVDTTQQQKVMNCWCDPCNSMNGSGKHWKIKETGYKKVNTVWFCWYSRTGKTHPW